MLYKLAVLYMFSYNFYVAQLTTHGCVCHIWVALGACAGLQNPMSKLFSRSVTKPNQHLKHHIALRKRVCSVLSPV